MKPRTWNQLDYCEWCDLPIYPGTIRWCQCDRDLQIENGADR